MKQVSIAQRMRPKLPVCSEFYIDFQQTYQKIASLLQSYAHTYLPMAWMPFTPLLKHVWRNFSIGVTILSAHCDSLSRIQDWAEKKTKIYSIK